VYPYAATGSFFRYVPSLFFRVFAPSYLYQGPLRIILNWVFNRFIPGRRRRIFPRASHYDVLLCDMCELQQMFLFLPHYPVDLASSSMTSTGKTAVLFSSCPFPPRRIFNVTVSSPVRASAEPFSSHVTVPRPAPR